MIRLCGAIALLFAIAGVGLADRRVVEVRIADAAFLVFDPNAKDVFIFTGAPPVRQSVVIGRRADGTEFRILPSPPASPASPAKGEEGPRPKLDTPGLPSLGPACASCHTAGAKVRGGFELFASDGKMAALKKEQWREVLSRITRDEKREGRMPPPEANKPAVSGADLAQIRRLAGE